VKFLTDAQTNFIFVDQLRKLGFDVETVYEHGVHKEKADERLVAWARTFGLVFVTFDQLRAETGVRVHEEIRLRGGKLIMIGGGPQQPVNRALGKFLFYHEEWYPRLSNEDGKFRIHDIKKSFEWKSRADLQQLFVKANPQHFDQFLQRRAAGQPTRRRSRRQTPQEQSHMHIPSGA
jgi:hypothetical protein